MKQWMLLGTVAVAVLGVSPAGAFTMTQKCVIANTFCFPVRAGVNGMSPERRIEHVNERLAYILGNEDLRPENVRTRDTSAGEVEIRVGGSLLATVTWADARANGAPDPRAVARIWMSNLRTAVPQARP